MRDIDPYGPERRSIRNIPVSRHTRSPAPEHRPRRPRRRFRRLGIIVAAFLGVCALSALLLSTVFAGAKINISPRTATVTPKNTIVARLNGPTGTLAYSMVSTTRSATTTIPAAGSKEVRRQASGVIAIENTYTTAPQRLIANTRFEAPDSKIYRIRDSITVPGMSGGKTGVTTATIYADSPGEAYNRTSPTTFTIPGFKGDPRYTKFAAHSQGPIEGGFVGTEPAVAEADLAKAKSELERTLDQAIRAAAEGMVPDGSVAIPGTLQISYSATAQTPAPGNKAVVVQSATATGAVVRIADLAAKIAENEVEGYGGESVLLDPGSALEMTATSTDPGKGSMTLKISGAALLVWQFDLNAVKQALLGKPKSQFETILTSFAPAVRCTPELPCEASIRPFWQSTFPSNPDKISITVRTAK